MKAQTVSTRLNREELAVLDELAAGSGLDRSAMTRSLVRKGLSEMRIDSALAAYAERRVTLSRAAELAGLSSWDLLARLAAGGGEIHYGVAEFEEDLDGQP